MVGGFGDRSGEWSLSQSGSGTSAQSSDPRRLSRVVWPRSTSVTSSQFASTVSGVAAWVIVR